MKYIKLIIEFIIETLKLAALSLPTIGYYTFGYVNKLQATSIMNIFEKWEYNEYIMYLCDRINSWYREINWEQFCSDNIFSIIINGIIVTLVAGVVFFWVYLVFRCLIMLPFFIGESVEEFENKLRENNK